MIDQRGLAFTPQQMSGYKGYSRGVLVGNWQEDLNVLQEKMRINTETRTRAAPVEPSTASVQPSPAPADGALRYGARVQIESCQGGWLLSVFPKKPRATLPQNHIFVSGAQPQHGVGPIGRNVWTLRPATMSGSGGGSSAQKSGSAAGASTAAINVPGVSLSASCSVTGGTGAQHTSLLQASSSSSSAAASSSSSAARQDVIRYGDTVMIVNEWGSAEGHLLLCSEHRTLLNAPSTGAGANKKAAQEVTAVLGETSLGNWVIEPAGVADGLDTARLLGKPVPVNASLVLRHALSGAPLGVDDNSRIRGMTNSKAAASDTAVECLIGCFNEKEPGSRSRSITNPANFFQFVLSPAGAPNVEPTHLPTSEQVFAQLLHRLEQRNDLFHSLRGLARTFRIVDKSRDRHLNRAELKVALGHFIGVDTFTNREIDMVFAAMDRNKDNRVCTTEFYRFIRGEMNSRRRKIVNEAFQIIAGPAAAVVPFSEMKRRYARGLSRHPEVLNGSKTEDQVVQDFIAMWDKNGDQTITWDEFADYYNDLSCTIDDDNFFELMVRNAWHMSGGEGVTENTSNKRVLVTHTDNTQKVYELKNDLGLNYDDHQAVLKFLDAQGVKNILEVDMKGGM